MPNDDTNWDFNIIGPNDYEENFYNLYDEDSKTLNNLDSGEYTITEINASDEYTIAIECSNQEVSNNDFLTSSQNNFRTTLVDTFNNYKMGDNVPITTIVKDISDADSNIVGTRILNMNCDGRTLVSAFMQLYFNERLIISEENINIV